MEDCLRIYSVVGCDLYYDVNQRDDVDFSLFTGNENANACVLRLDLRVYTATIIEKNKEVYTIKEELFGEEYSGTKEELFQDHGDDTNVFSMEDIIETKYIFNGKILDDEPFDFEPFGGFDMEWHSEQFFISEEKASDFFQEFLEESCKEKKSAGIEHDGILKYS